MKPKTITHEDILKKLERKWPGFRQEVKIEVARLRRAAPTGGALKIDSQRRRSQ